MDGINEDTKAGLVIHISVVMQVLFIATHYSIYIRPKFIYVRTIIL